MNKQEAIDSLECFRRNTAHILGDNDEKVKTIETCMMLVREAEETERWIPVSERLPEEYEYVLLCDREPEPDENTDYSQMAVGWLEDGQICCWDDRATRNEFVAWMPLPEPYKERREE